MVRQRRWPEILAFSERSHSLIPCIFGDSLEPSYCGWCKTPNHVKWMTNLQPNCKIRWKLYHHTTVAPEDLLFTASFMVPNTLLLLLAIKTESFEILMSIDEHNTLKYFSVKMVVTANSVLYKLVQVEVRKRYIMKSKFCFMVLSFV